MIVLICLGVFLTGALGAFTLPDYGPLPHIDRDCIESCLIDPAPVCGTDGHTYLNMCIFRGVVCTKQKQGVHLALWHNGSCSDTSTVSRTRATHCDTICDEEPGHVCGSDGNVYINECSFQRAQCELARDNGTQIFMVTRGDTCPTPRAPNCDKYHVDSSDLALEGPNPITINCAHIPHHNLCASNGRNFPNECSICQHMEQSGEQLQILSDARCAGHISHSHHPTSSSIVVGK